MKFLGKLIFLLTAVLISLVTLTKLPLNNQVVAAEGDPYIQIITPLDNSQVSGDVLVTTVASSSAVIQNVDFYIDNVRVASDSAAPYEMVWHTQGLPIGSTHTILAVLYDSVPRIATSTVNVTITDATTPTVQIVNPKDGSFVKKNSSISIQAIATDNVAVSRVEFYVNGQLKCTDLVLPYICAWKVPVKKGIVYVLEARAYDGVGNVSISKISVVSQ